MVESCTWTLSMIASEPASSASPDAAAAANTEEPTPAYSRLRSRESRTPRPLREEKGTEARRRVPAYGDGERGLDREQESGIRNLAVSAADSIARSDFPFASFFSLLRRGREGLIQSRSLREWKRGHVGHLRVLFVSEFEGSGVPKILSVFDLE
jgi:hypothetical protein